MSRRVCLLLALHCAGCISRTEVGAEPAPALNDAGSRSDASAEEAGDAALDADQQKIRDFEQLMIGTWQGPVETPLLGSLSLVMTFKPKFAYVMCNASGQCSEPGLYFVTDLLTNGHFAGELQNRSMERTAWLDDIWIDDVDGSEVLHFTLYDELSLLNAALTRASD